MKEEQTIAAVDVTFAGLKKLGEVECMALAFEALRQKWVDPYPERETNVRSGTVYVGVNEDGTLCFEFVARVKLRPGEFEMIKKEYDAFFAARSGYLVKVEERVKIYVASSWRNLLQPGIVMALRKMGHEVYNFRHPEGPGSTGFAWSEIDPKWQSWTVDDYRKALTTDVAKRGYARDIGALKSCDVCVLVLPSGRSASWEFGYAMGQGKRGIVVALEPQEPDLMYAEATIVSTMDELFDAFGFEMRKTV